MQIPLLHVDAFTDRVFGGNPAAVCPLVDWPGDGLLQAIAAENNLSETAFLAPVPTPGRYRLRWFTPTREVDLCGHATLAAAHVVFTQLRPEVDEIGFETRSGVLTVRREEELLCMELPAVPATLTDAPPNLVAALGGGAPLEAHAIAPLHGADYFMLVYAGRAQVQALAPTFAEMTANVVATAANDPGADDCDFVSRFFAPASGLDEDPATGSTHCTLAPYWAAKLGKPALVGRQLSARGATLWCEPRGDRVLLRGRCVDYLSGMIHLPRPPL